LILERGAGGIHRGDTENTEGHGDLNFKFEISDLRFEILKPPCDLRVLLASVVNFDALFTQA
jgi:hypothetical protein